jgi:hypothetical protein
MVGCTPCSAVSDHIREVKASHPIALHWSSTSRAIRPLFVLFLFSLRFIRSPHLLLAHFQSTLNDCLLQHRCISIFLQKISPPLRQVHHLPPLSCKCSLAARAAPVLWQAIVPQTPGLEVQQMQHLKNCCECPSLGIFFLPRVFGAINILTDFPLI